MKLTPLMHQYQQMKKSLPENTLLLCRLGDFYELFFEDAELGSKILGITLTKRNGVAMAGIPYHAIDNYLSKALTINMKVAIAEQIIDPAQAKGIVERKIIKIITPGSITDDKILNPEQNNFFLCLYKGSTIGLAFIDLSTSEFRVMEIDKEKDLETEITKLNPKECLISRKHKSYWETKDYLKKVLLTEIEDYFFYNEPSNNYLSSQFKIEKTTIENFPTSLKSAKALLQYIREELLIETSHIKDIIPCFQKGYMLIDKSSQKNLELVEPLFVENKDATLLSVLNKTITPMGNRMMRSWILRPLKNKDKIIDRQNAVGTLVKNIVGLEELREILYKVRDIERIMAKVNIGSANARDVYNLKTTLEIIPDIKNILTYLDKTSLIEKIQSNLIPLNHLVSLIQQAINPDAPLSLREGSIINPKYSNELDELRSGANRGKEILIDFEQKERERTKIKFLKVRYNKPFGYFIEVPQSSASLVPENYIRRQTMTKVERFSCPELKNIENLILSSDERAKALEYEIFQKIREEVLKEIYAIQKLARNIAIIDTLQSLAHVATYQNYTKPTLSNESIIEIVNGRHPIIDKIILNEFIPNNTSMDKMNSYLHLITGPNMAGKSTYIRQIALISLMAQIGSYVPADKVTIGVFDSIYTRVGAADNLAQGQSTFMVEMVETANILNHCSDNSLIILDEIGRGTSTYDGLSLAWAITEYLQSKNCFTLFATHYHELTQLEDKKQGIKNFSVIVQKINNKITFLHKIKEGAVNKSYGINVAQLAGLPNQVIKRAEIILKDLEQICTETGKIIKTQKKKLKLQEDTPNLFDF